MEITKPNDLFVASLNNPQATTYDLMSANLTPDNTSLYTKDEYKGTKFVQDRFKNDKGQFDDVAFDSFYNKVSNQYKEMTDDTFLKGLDTIKYSPFDITRPKGADTYKVSVEFSKDYNPYKQTYSRTGINSIEDGNLTLRELAQKSKVYDPEADTWSVESANDMNLLNKFFGDTLVYAQYDDDGIHQDLETGRSITHKKGDWKINNDGNLFLEKLGNREIYGKQVVNPSDMLTTDGSFVNKLDIWDSDSKEKSVWATTAKVAFDIAPFLIPGVGEVYGGIKAAIGLSAVMPTFYKSLEGMLLGDTPSYSMEMATAAEGYLAKFNQNSISDASQGTFFNYEQMSQMVSSVFSQLYEQRAAASLAMIIKKPSMNIWEGKAKEVAEGISKELGEDLMKGKVTMKTLTEAFEVAKAKIPQLESVMKEQGHLAKSLSLGYMAITSTSDIYGQALESGYDRRTAGFAALASAAGQYGIMMNNRMGDWFLDKSTGYTLETNKALVRKAVMPLMKEIQTATAKFEQNAIQGKIKLAGVFGKIRNSFEDVFLTPSVVGEAMWKNSIVEGVEELTEQVVLDTTKGIVDTMSWLGLTKKQGSFGGTDVVFSKMGFENYLANFVGGVLGGAMFEFNRIKIEPFMSNKITEPDTRKQLYELIADGHKDQLLEAIQKQKHKFGNKYIGLVKEDGTYDVTPDGTLSQSELIAKEASTMVETLDGILNSQDLKHTDVEIVKKAIRDAIIIKDLNEAKDKIGNKEIGLEGLILTDFKDKMQRITSLTEQINGFNTDDDKEKNKESISELEKERNLYRTEVNEILLGEKAETYYNRISFYLNKEISKHWIVIDKDTFTQHKYKRSFKDLTEKGLGITKERINKEYKEYIEGKDVFRELGVVTDAYLAYEQTLNGAIADYVTNGYANEVTKTFKNLINNPETNRLFSSQDGETTNHVINFLETARKIETESGVKILPWDVIFSTTDEKIKNSSGYVVTNKNKIITLPDGSQMKIGEIAGNLLTSVINQLPPEHFDYNTLSDLFKDQVDLLNFQIVQANAQLPEGTRKSEKEIEKDLIKAEIQKYDVTPQFLEKLALALPDIQAKFLSNNFTIEDIQYFSNPLAILKLEEVATNLSLLDLISTLDTAAKPLGIDPIAQKMYEEFQNAIGDLTDITDEEKSNIILTGKYTGESKEAAALVDQFEEFLLSERDRTNAGIKVRNAKAEIFEIYNNEVVTAKKDIISNSPSLFKVADVLILQLVKEIKTNKNLDGEVLKMAKNLIRKYLLPITSISNYINFTEEDIIELGSSKNLDSFSKDLNDLMYAFGTSNVLDDELGDLVFNFATKYSKGNQVAKRVVSAAKELLAITAEESGDPELTKTKVDSILVDFKNIIAKISESRPVLEKVNEIFGVTSNSKKFISNPLYDLLRQINLSLDSGNQINKTSIFDILEGELYKLSTASDLSTYFANGGNIQDIDQAINAVKLAQSVVLAMSTTELSFADAYGFIMSRQNFVKNNNLKSDSSSLFTITSDMAQLMREDLERISTKLGFLRDLAKYNSGLISREQKIIRTKVNKILITKWTALSKKDIKFKEKPLIPDLTEILNSEEEDQIKVFKIENAFYESTKEYTTEEKIEIGKLLAEQYKYINTLQSLYSKDGIDEITKDVKDISNNDMLLYLLTNMVISTKDFNIKLQGAFKQGFDKAPFFTQELGVKIMYASLVNKELFAEICKSLSPIEETLSNKEAIQTHDTSLITYILGNAGTGKTTVMFKLLISILLQSNPNLNIWFSGPRKEQAEKLWKDATSNLEQTKINQDKFSKLELLEKLGIKQLVEDIEKDKKTIIKESGETIRLNEENTILFLNDIELEFKSDLPDIIFIDEVSHYKAFELDLINRVVKNAADHGKIIKVFAAGDQYQEGADYGEGNTAINYNIDRVSGIFIPQLFLTIRAQNNQKRDNNEVLVNTVRKIGRIWDNADKSTHQVFSSFLQEGISLKFHQSEKDFTGDLLSNNIPNDVLETIARNLKKDSTKTVGILTENGEVSDAIATKLKNAGIPVSVDGSGGYINVSTKQVQGREFDYFIFPMSLVERKSIYDTLKTLYTYSSRAKSGSIILTDKELAFSERKLILTQKEEGTTQILSPLNDEEILKLKEEREKELTLLLGPGATLSNDFSFNAVNKETSEANSDGTIAKEDEVIDELVNNVEKETLAIKFSISEVEKKNAGSVNTLIHTFYHDLGITEEVVGEDVFLTLNPNAKYNYIIAAKFGNAKAKQKMKLSEYKILKQDVIKEKFNILNTGDVSSQFVKIFGSNVTLNQVTRTLAIVADTYNDAYNNPKNLTYNDSEERLKTGDKYLNLVMKLTFNGEDFIIPLGTFAKLSTIEKFYGKTHSVYTSYRDLLENAEIGKYGLIEKNRFQVITSTRLYTPPAIDAEEAKKKRQRITLRELRTKNGLLFYNSEWKLTPEPEINFFPKTLEAYRRLFEKTTFGNPMTEEQLLKSFDARKGKPYIRVSYINNVKHIQFITLHSKKRSWAEIEKLIYGEKAIDGSSLKDKLLACSRIGADGKKVLDSEKLAEVNAISSSLFSADDVVDLWIALARKRPELYDALMSNGQKWMDSITEGADLKSKQALQDLLGTVQVGLEKTPLGLITYGSTGAAIVYKRIMEVVKSHPDEDNKELKKRLLDLWGKPTTKFWSSRFWNIFKLQYELEHNRNIIASSLNQEFAEALGNIVEFWKGIKPDGLYYNVPIFTGKEKKSFGVVKVNTLDLDALEDNLYTGLEPEGPHFLLDLNGIAGITVDSDAIKLTFLNTLDQDTAAKTKAFLRQIASKLGIVTFDSDASTGIRKKISTAKISLETIKTIIAEINAEGDKKKLEEIEIIKKAKELASIKYKRAVILKSVSSDTLKSLEEKIVKATMIKDILNSPSNIKILEELVSLSLIQLTNLSSNTDKGKVEKAKLDFLYIKTGKEGLPVSIVNTLEKLLETNPNIILTMLEKLESSSSTLQDIIENAESYEDFLSDVELAISPFEFNDNERNTLYETECI